MRRSSPRLTAAAAAAASQLPSAVPPLLRGAPKRARRSPDWEPPAASVAAAAATDDDAGGGGQGVSLQREVELLKRRRKRGGGVRHVVGTDEAGRGPLAGPVVAAAVAICPRQCGPDILALLQDSKKLTQAQRERAFKALLGDSAGVRWAAAAASPREIDEINILQASLRAMATAVTRLARADTATTPARSPEQVLSHEAIAALYGRPDLESVTGKDYAVLVDGPHIPPDLVDVVDAESVIGGDGKCASIAAASIIAKVIRDWYMIHVLDAKYPMYGFSRHKGYPTAAHRAALLEHGPCPEHRFSYSPVAQAAQQTSKDKPNKPAGSSSGRRTKRSPS